MAQEPELSIGSPLRVEPLNTREVGVQDRDQCIEDLVVQSSSAMDIYQSRCHILKPLSCIALRC
jgi:hypothetical protein